MKSPPSIRPPFDDLVKRTQDRVMVHCGEGVATGGLGLTLVQVFARMAQHVVDRINLLPERSFLAYADLLGVPPNPPRAARVPLTFELAKGAAEPTIPIGARVAAAPAEGDLREVVFETTQALSTVRAELVAAIVAQGASGNTLGCYEDVTTQLSGREIDGVAILNPGSQKELTTAEYRAADFLDEAPRNSIVFMPNDRPNLDSIFPLLEIGGARRRWLEKSPRGVKLSTPPLATLLNGRPLDMTKPFRPFGERPAVQDCFYVALCPAMIRAGSEVMFDTTPDSILTSDVSPKLVWEVETPNGWEGVSNGKVPLNALVSKRSGTEACWLRIRIDSGGYGAGLEYTAAVDNKPAQVTVDYHAPILTDLRIEYTISSPNCDTLSYSNLCYYKADEKDTNCLSEEPALYLAFNRPFPNRRVALYVQVAALSPEDLAAVGPVTPPQVIWEYWSGSSWTRLGMQDGTRGLTTTGLVEFIGPVDLPRALKLGHEAHWLRIRRVAKGTYEPRIERILTNTVWATHTTTITNEVLGSSNGEPEQRFRLAQRPVLLGERIEVQEPAPPSTADPGRLESSAGAWVTWTAAPDFHTSGPDDRHYVLDRASGEVLFGGGGHGKVPPRGSQNIRATRYQTGGGEDGRRPARSITVLKSSIAHVKGVTNHEPASGEAGWESAESRLRRAPRVLRHRGRAVTVEDLEDLAYEASPAVARVKVVPGIVTAKGADENYEPKEPSDLADVGNRTGVALGATHILVVPRSPLMPPRPQSGLLQGVESFLRGRSSPLLNFKVMGPEWVKISATFNVTPEPDVDVEELRETLSAAASAFMHPLTGGSDGEGWDFGRVPASSDLLRALWRIDGVDTLALVGDLSLEPDPPPAPISPRTLIYPGEMKFEFGSGEAP